MKKWLKKQKYKIAIALCSILSIFTLFLGINKTYAYETDLFSYTLSYDSLFVNNSSCVVTQNNNNIQFNGYAVSTSIPIRIKFNLNNTANTNTSYYLMINYLFEYSSDNINFNIYSVSNSNNQNANRTMSIQANYDSFGNVYSFNNMYMHLSNTNLHNNMYTDIGNISINQNNIDVTYDNVIIAPSLACYYSSYPFYYRFTIYNVDYVSKTDIGLSQYYDTYYGQIEDNYNTLLNNYNDLQEDYSTLEGNYNTLQDNYDDLESNYNNLQDNYDDLENDYNTLESSYESLAFEYNDLQSQFDTLENALSNLPNYNGVQSFLDSFNGAIFELYGYAGISGKIQNSPTFTLSNFNNSNFNLSRDTDTFYTWIQNNINTYGGFDLIITLNVPYTTSLSCSFSNVNYIHGVSIYSDVNGLAVATYDDSNNSSVVLINENNNYSIVMIRLSITQQDYDFILSSNINGDQYMNGYNNGYNQSLIEWNSELNTARNTIESQRNTIRTLQQQLNTANQYDLNKLMWTIGSTPFESFKQIWNVDFFGVNISSMITGFITGIVVLWIIKKFFL